MNRIKLLVVITAFTLLSPPAALAQRRDGELRELKLEVEALREGQKALRDELREIRELLKGLEASPALTQRAVLSTDGLPFKGGREALLTVVEFSDYQCPFCARHAHETLPQIERDYIRTGKVKYVFGDLPLGEIHPRAQQAARSAYCASEQGKFWEMHDQLFANPNAFSNGELSLHAQAVGLDVLAFQRCLFGNRHEERLRRGRELAGSMGLKGTPAFVIGLTDPATGTVEVLKVLVGAQPYASFRTALDTLAAAAGR